jgi:CHASE2 domain-containing sensor protein
VASGQTDDQTDAQAIGQTVGTSSAYEQFLQQIETMPNLFLVCFRDSSDENYGAPSQLSLPLQIDQMGFSDLPVDGARVWLGGSRGDLTPQGSTALTGEVVRRQVLSYDPSLLLTPSACTTPYSFSFQMAYQYLYEKGITPLEVTPDEHWRFGSVVFESLPQRFGGYQQLDTPISQILLNYRANQPAQKITVEQLFADGFDPQLLRDRIVMVGYTAPVSKDYFATPYGPMAGLWIHAHMASQLMSAVIDNRPLIHTLPQWRSWQWGDWLWVLLWGCVGGALAGVSRRRSPWLIAVALSLLLLSGLCWLALISGLWLPWVPGALASLGSTVWIRLNRHSLAALPEQSA